MKRNPLEVLGIPQDLLQLFVSDPERCERFLGQYKKWLLANIHPDNFAGTGKEREATEAFARLSSALDEVKPQNLRTLLKAGTGPTLTPSQRTQLILERDELRTRLEITAKELRQKELELSETLEPLKAERDEAKALVIEWLRSLLFPEAIVKAGGLSVTPRLEEPVFLWLRRQSTKGALELFFRELPDREVWAARLYLVTRERVIYPIEPNRPLLLEGKGKDLIYGWADYCRRRNTEFSKVLERLRAGQSIEAIRGYKDSHGWRLVGGSPAKCRRRKRADFGSKIFQFRDDDYRRFLGGIRPYLLPSDTVVVRSLGLGEAEDGSGWVTHLSELGELEAVSDLEETARRLEGWCEVLEAWHKRHRKKLTIWRQNRLAEKRRERIASQFWDAFGQVERQASREARQLAKKRKITSYTGKRRLERELRERRLREADLTDEHGQPKTPNPN